MSIWAWVMGAGGSMLAALFTALWLRDRAQLKRIGDLVERSEQDDHRLHDAVAKRTEELERAAEERMAQDRRGDAGRRLADRLRGAD